MKAILRFFLLFQIVIVLTACGVEGKSEPATDLSDELFDPDQLIDVNIEMAANDFKTLRAEGRNFGNVFDNCAEPFEYTRFQATAIIEGERIENVEIRKKGFLGSLSYSRPSLKLNFSNLVEGRTFKDMQRMTLNNDHQDPGQNHQCLTYQMFRDAGLAAPRCNFARVTVNNQLIGIYSHIESIKKPFLTRNFADDSGNLYEGQIADFRESLKSNFQLKTNDEENDRSDLDEVIAALALDDDLMPTALANVVDIDQFLTFWAMEIITGHWDSATTNANNYYIYKNPSDGLFNFIPWGTDGALSVMSVMGNSSSSVINPRTAIPSRLYTIPEYRKKLHDRIATLMEKHWDNDKLLAEVDRMSTITGVEDEVLVQIREFIEEQPARIDSALNTEFEEQDVDSLIATLDTEECMSPETIQLTGTLNGNSASYSYLNSDGETVAVNNASLSDALLPSFFVTLPPPKSLSLISFSGGSMKFIMLNIEEPEFKVGKIDLHGAATMAFYVDMPLDSLSLDLSNINEVGMGLSGTITIDDIDDSGLPYGSFVLDFMFLSDDGPLGDLFAF